MDNTLLAVIVDLTTANDWIASIIERAERGVSSAEELAGELQSAQEIIEKAKSELLGKSAASVFWLGLY